MLLNKLWTSSNGGFGRLFLLFPYAFFSTRLLGYLKATGMLRMSVPVLAISPIFLLAALLVSYMNIRDIRIRTSDFLLFGSIVFLTIIVPFLVSSGSVFRYSQEYLEILFVLLVPTLAGYIYGSFVEKKSSLIILAISFLTVLVVIAVDLTQNRYGISVGRFGGSSVLALSDLLAASSLFAIYFLRSTGRFLLGITCLIFLIILASFTSVVIFASILFILLLSDMLRSAQRRRMRFSIIQAIFLSLTVFTIILNAERIGEIVAPFVDSFLLRLNSVIDLGDASAVTRIKLLNETTSVIIESPLIGKWGYYFRESGYTGYAHNILSWWADYGVMTFLAVLVMQAKYVYLSYKDFSKRSSSRRLGPVFLPLLFLFVASLVSRAHRFELVWFYIGLSFSLASQMNTEIGGESKQ